VPATNPVENLFTIALTFRPINVSNHISPFVGEISSRLRISPGMSQNANVIGRSAFGNMKTG
jgi:hypothetical protein